MFCRFDIAQFYVALLSSSLATAEVEKRSLENLKTDPPVILFSEELAVLMLFDGEPRFTDKDPASRRGFQFQERVKF